MHQTNDEIEIERITRNTEKLDEKKNNAIFGDHSPTFSGCFPRFRSSSYQEIEKRLEKMLTEIKDQLNTGKFIWKMTFFSTK